MSTSPGVRITPASVKARLNKLPPIHLLMTVNQRRRAHQLKAMPEAKRLEVSRPVAPTRRLLWDRLWTRIAAIWPVGPN